MFMDPAGKAFIAKKLRQVFQRGGSYAGHAAIMHYKPLLGLLPDSLDLTECGLHLGLASQVPVECDAETMGLVADLLEKLQRL